ncbi:Leucine-rich repeat receptor-like serine/threonine/tyrosine-protein kinase SOBIR1 [Camellia lanceoleosa]|uniref:Leucine-rich repeat receptor-like serine/threonine/tyrosine-protein kinase SOBIR1 n=1 Tax=Camellia lanceoleosa TaxID=1840588 RepID=A0ACC0I5F4_9ERIC|nr:Leucine-rich repeat receptor-like serine/threonine/tyrosine-protein kinase SOBIR1 [Camellia lanceoleosa]
MAIIDGEQIEGRDLAGASRTRGGAPSQVIVRASHEPRHNGDGVLHHRPPPPPTTTVVLPNLVMTSEEEDPNRAIDPRLMGNGEEDKMLLVLKIACFCTLDNPKQRPNSKEVRCMLSQIKN